MLRGLDLNPGPSTKPMLVLTDQERQQARARMDSLPSPRVVVHPGGFAARTWRAANYGELIRKLVRDGFGVVLTGSKAEGVRFRDDGLRAEAAGRGVLDLMGAVSLRELMAVIAASQCVVSGATGPAHMAAALAVPTVSLFDPRRNNLPVRWQPLGQGVVLRPDVPTCEKCIYEACPYWDCLDRITTDTVAARVRQVIGQVQPLQVLHV
jgi:heptosyltransferase-2